MRNEPQEITLADYRALAKRGAKYGNKRAGGFDSLDEAARLKELLLLEAAGVISDLRIKPRYVVFDAYTTYQGENVRAITYIPDYDYLEKGRRVVEDVKGGGARPRQGTRTEVFELKRKLFMARYPDILFRIVEVDR